MNNTTITEEYEEILQKVFAFLDPIEKDFTGLGLITLFSFLANLTNAGVIMTAPMGAGKTIVARLLEHLHRESKLSHYVISFQEFKKTDWITMFPLGLYDYKRFFFCIPEISALPKYSQDFFLQRIPALQSDGEFEYIYGKEKEERIKITNSDCSYFIASQPPKTYAIINDTTFKTLANDRCWNLLLINQIRGRKNTHISKCESTIKQIKFFRPSEKHNENFERTCFKYDLKDIRFESKDIIHLTESSLNISLLEDVIRNQFSVDRREEQMDNILRAFCSFLNIKICKQIHIDIFVSLFSFYVQLFNKFTIGSVEQSIDIKYGAMEMLCRMSALISRKKVITQQLLTKEFNSTDENVNFFLYELEQSNIIVKNNIKDTNPFPRSHRKKSSKTVRKNIKTLSTVQLITSKRAKAMNLLKQDNIVVNEVIYEFTDQITSFFDIYKQLLLKYLDSSTVIAFNHLKHKTKSLENFL